MGGNKPTVLVLGGVGYLGRNFVHYIISNDLAGSVRVVDKVMPPMAWMNKAHKESFKSVEFKHANLINCKNLSKLFELPDGSSFDYVVNCAAETKYDQTEEVYKDGIYKLSCNCAREAARTNVKCYIEVSSANMYSSEKVAIKEDVCCEPWTEMARYKQMVEQELSNIPDLNYIIVRPALVYGVADKWGLAPKLVIGAVYKHTQEKLQLLWTKDLKMNTVHVEDVSRAIWHLFSHGKTGEIYHLADKADSTQGSIANIISEIFNIKHEFLGTLPSKFAQLSLSDIVEDINEKHMVPWGEICQTYAINNTPLSPCIDKEVLSNKHLNLDGSKMEGTGFQYEHPKPTHSLIKQILMDFVNEGLFPPQLIANEETS